MEVVIFIEGRGTLEVTCFLGGKVKCGLGGRTGIHGEVTGYDNKRGVAALRPYFFIYVH